jgi:hypothetical protein
MKTKYQIDEFQQLMFYIVCNDYQEIASMLIAFDLHHEWMSKEVRIRSVSAFLLKIRKKVAKTLHTILICD